MKTKRTIVAVIGIVSALYLLNPGIGIFEIIPDNFPFIGNLDEATAAFLLLSSLAYFGIDFRDVFGGFFRKNNIPPVRWNRYATCFHFIKLSWQISPPNNTQPCDSLTVC